MCAGGTDAVSVCFGFRTQRHREKVIEVLRMCLALSQTR